MVEVVEGAFDWTCGHCNECRMYAKVPFPEPDQTGQFDSVAICIECGDIW